MARKTTTEEEVVRNPDPLTGEPGSHPAGTAGGGVAGAATGAAIGGALGGPIGAAVGGILGAIAGAAAGHGYAELIHPSNQDEYWRNIYRTRPYYKEGTGYDLYADAYRFGWEAAARPELNGKNFEQVEMKLKDDWVRQQTQSGRAWEDVREVVRDAFLRTRTYEDDEAYWQSVYQTRPYYVPGTPFNFYIPAYFYGTESAMIPEMAGRPFEDVATELEHYWRKNRKDRPWDDVKEAVRDAYERTRSR